MVKIVDGDANKTLALGEAVWVSKDLGVFSKTVLQCGHQSSSRAGCVDGLCIRWEASQKST